jgi:hypothetical protein
MLKFKKDSLLSIIRPGDIIGLRTESISGRLIRWTTSSNINHVALYLGNGLVIESQLGYGVRILPLSIYTDDDYSEVYLYRARGLRNIQQLIEYSYIFYGEKYNLISQIGIFARFMVKKMSLDKYITFLGNNHLNFNGLWCSEFLALVFLSESIRFQELDPSYISPSDICNSNKVDIIDY